MQVDLIVFEVGSATFALNLEYVNRINTIPEITPAIGTNKLIEGMISYESTILYVVSLRAIINQVKCSDELLSLFNDLKKQHEIWIESLKATITTGVEFRGTLNPHMCVLGKWIDNFTSYDDKISVILRELTSNHTELHNLGADVIELLNKDDKQNATLLFEKELLGVYNQTMSALNLMIDNYEIVANSLQKLLLYKDNEDYFALKVDKIVDIVYIDDTQIVKSKDVDSKVESPYITFDGILDMNGTLINVVKNIALPK